MSQTVWKTEIPDLPPPKRGKVRDVYDLGDLLLIVACDRISAYDHVLQPGIPGKGKILTQLSNFWFQKFQAVVPNHLVATDVGDYPAELAAYAEMLDGRSVLVKKAAVVPFECVARGYLAGSGFREYTDSRSVCGILYQRVCSVPANYRRLSSRRPPRLNPGMMRMSPTRSWRLVSETNWHSNSGRLPSLSTQWEPITRPPAASYWLIPSSSSDTRQANSP